VVQIMIVLKVLHALQPEILNNASGLILNQQVVIMK